MKYIQTYENYNYSDILSEIDTFLKSGIRNTYVNDDKITMYIRKSQRLVNKQTVKFFDIGNISIDENYWGKGIFTNLISNLISKYPDMNIFVESILNPAIETALNKFNFEKQDLYGQINMFRIINI